MKCEYGYIYRIDERDWRIEGVIVDTKDWWPGGFVMIQPSAIDRIDWPERRVYLKVDRAAVKSSPEYHTEVPGTA